MGGFGFLDGGSNSSDFEIQWGYNPFMKDKPRQHHYVPQAYLRLFSDNDSGLHVYDKVTKSIRLTSAKGVAYSHDFYTVDTVDEKDSAEVEETFSKIENLCIPIIKSLSEGLTVYSNADYADLSIYIALQYWRTPTARAKMDNFSKVMATHELREKLREVSTDRKVYDALLTEFQNEHPDIVLPPMETIGKWANSSLELAEFKWDNGSFVKSVFGMAEEIAKGLLSSRWILLQAPKDTQFITSDNPIVMRLTRRLKTSEIPAILLPGTDKLFPVSSKRCLLIIDGSWKGIGSIKLTRSSVRSINRLTYLQASKYVLSGSKNLLESITSLH